MQLFSIGLYQLNPDGTQVLVDGKPVETYTIDDIVQYSKAWTGFSGRYKRGGTSTSDRHGDDSLDPMMINPLYRDLFPKSDLQGELSSSATTCTAFLFSNIWYFHFCNHTSAIYLGGFIGDRSAPLCSDLPAKHFTRKGAIYKLLGPSPKPELHTDKDSWGPETKRLELSPSSPLFDKLCSPSPSGECTFPSNIVLDSNLIYDDAAKMGDEWAVDTIRTVKLLAAGMSSPIYYEYVRQPCVEYSYYGNAVKMMKGEVVSGGVQTYPAVCGDPRLPIATPMCCSSGWQTTNELGHIYCNYQGERTTFESAQAVCAANGEEQCQPWKHTELLGGQCASGSKGRHFRSWASVGCSLRAKIDLDSGDVAIVVS